MSRKSRLKAWLSLAVMWLVSSNAWALDQKDGVYQIGSADDLAAFAELVNGGETAIDAVLTADIDYSANTQLIHMVGTSENPYEGTFDGQFHRITVAFFVNEVAGEGKYVEDAAIIRVANLKATIKNLIVDGTINTNQKYAAGICAYAGAYITHCASYVDIVSTVNGDGTHGGIVGHTTDGVRIDNCLAAGSIKGNVTTNCGGIMGWAGNKCSISNCLQIADIALLSQDGSATIARNGGNVISYNNYYVSNYGDKDEKATQVTADMLADGSVCYMLNGDQTAISWWQNIGTDEQPVLGTSGAQVYVSEGTIACDGKVTDGKFTNTVTFNKPAAHDDVCGTCQTCGRVDPHFAPEENGYYMLASAPQLRWFGNLIAQGQTYAKAKLTEDIDFTEYGQIETTGTYFNGELDGQNHLLTIHIESVPDQDGPAPFRCLGGIVRNLRVSGDINASTKYAGSIAGHTSNEAVIENCYSDVNIVSTLVGDGTHGGFIGVVDGVTSMNGCMFAGSLKSPELVTTSCGGLAGWANNTFTVTNSLLIGDVDVSAESSYTICRNPGNVKCKNVFYVSEFGTVNSGAAPITTDELQSGKGCYALNGGEIKAPHWFQTIGSDELPVMDSSHKIVYATGTLTCDGRMKDDFAYSNTYSEPTQDEHNFENGICTECGEVEYVPEQDADGYYLLANSNDLYWLASAVKGDATDLKVRLTADVDMSEAESFEGIGSTEKPFKGHFDGQNHRISGLTLDVASSGVGFFNFVAAPSTIENMVLDESCSINGDAYVGLVGETHGSYSGNVVLRNLGNEGIVTATGANAGGILGCCMSSKATIEITNCFVYGTVRGGNESGIISGWLGSDAKVNNTWAVGEVEGIQSGASFARFSSVTFTNCYSSTEAQDNVKTTSEDEMQDGRLAYKLNGSSYKSPNWYQTLGDDLHPVTDSTHGIVYYSAASEEYRDVHDDDSFEDFKTDIVGHEENYCDEVVAQATLVDAYRELLSSCYDAADMAEFATLWEGTETVRKNVQDSEKAYKSYSDRVQEVVTYLEEHLDFSGEKRDIVTDYVEGDEEPSELYPNGCAGYILEHCLLNAEQLAAETEFLNKLLEDAIRDGFDVGAEVTSFIANADFTKDNFEGWEGQKATGSGGSTTTSVRGGECWNSTFDMYQTLKGLQNGVYELCINGATRPYNTITNNNYIAGIYANENFVYMMADIEDMISVEDAVDGENCNLTGDVSDLAVTNEEGDTIGYVMHGVISVCNAAAAGRYQNRILARVTDGTLKIGIKSPGTGLGNDWTGFANIRLFYQGDLEDAGEALDNTLAGQVARANTLINADGEGYMPKEDTSFETMPNFSQSLKDQLQEAINAVGEAATAEDKYALINRFSTIFQDIYPSKAAYVAMFKQAEALNSVTSDLLQSGLIDDATAQAGNAAAETLQLAYLDGSYTTEEAQNLDALKQFSFIPQTSDDALQLNDAANLLYYAAMVNAGFRGTSAKLNTDLDLEGVVVTPIGTNENPFNGKFDGQAHTISNLHMESAEAVGYGFFGWIVPPATIENLRLDANCFISGDHFVGMIGSSKTGYSGDIYMNQLANEGNVTAVNQNAGGIIGCCEGGSATFHINNCYTTGTITGGNESGAISGWINGTGVVTDSWSIATVTGVQGDDTYFARPATATYNNCYSLNGTQANRIAEGDLASGSLTYKLNGKRFKDVAWTQILGVDEMPQLWGSTDGIVYYVNGEYTNTRPDMFARAYAYNIISRSHADRVDIGYALNAPAKSAEIRFYSGNDLVYTHPLSAADLTAGNHAVSVDNANLPADATLRFDIRTEFVPVDKVYPIGDAVKAYKPLGIAVNDCPDSPSFGNLYMGEAVMDHGTDTGYISDSKPAGVFAFDPLLQSIDGADGTPGFTGGVDLSQEGPQIAKDYPAFGPKTVRVSNDGRLFVGLTNGRTSSPIWEIDQQNLDAPWTPVFTGGQVDAETGITYVDGQEQSRMMVSFDTYGSGDNLVLYTLAAQRSDGNYNYSDYVANTYNLGSKDSWNTVPSSQIDALTGQYTISPQPVNIVSDRQGGLWYIQYRSNPSEVQPAIKHYNAEGVEDYSDVNTSTYGGAMAISRDGGYIAFPTAAKNVTIYEVNYVPMANGHIYLNPMISLQVTEGDQIMALAFDYALNLFAASSYSHTMSQYTLPAIMGTEAVVPAPAAATFTVGTETGIQTITSAEVADSDVYSLDGKLVRKAGNVKGLRGIYVVKGRKYLIQE